MSSIFEGISSGCSQGEAGHTEVSSECLGGHSGDAKKKGCEVMGELHADAEMKKGVGEAADKHEPASLDDVVKELKGIKLKFTSCCTKLSLIELRQSNTQGEGTDAVRAAHQWAIGESATLPLKAVQVITKHMLANPQSIQEQGTYTSLFFQKDLRRGYRFVIEMWWGMVCNEIEF